MDEKLNPVVQKKAQFNPQTNHQPTDQLGLLKLLTWLPVNSLYIYIGDCQMGFQIYCQSNAPIYLYIYTVAIIHM